MAAFYRDLLVAAVALMMVLSGLQKGVLVLRETRSCPACGREIRVCRCR